MASTKTVLSVDASSMPFQERRQQAVLPSGRTVPITRRPRYGQGEQDDDVGNSLFDRPHELISAAAGSGGVFGKTPGLGIAAGHGT